MMWTGGYANYDRSFQWVDGQPFNYEQWAANEPSNDYSKTKMGYSTFKIIFRAALGNQADLRDVRLKILN